MDKESKDLFEGYIRSLTTKLTMFQESLDEGKWDKGYSIVSHMMQDIGDIIQYMYFRKGTED